MIFLSFYFFVLSSDFSSNPYVSKKCSPTRFSTLGIPKVDRNYIRHNLKSFYREF
ncbi:hypothetical protein LEP1GSC192_0843 [Leptospira sp. B5-022]|nr:hypothetical protein LEP1GSC192_0843 [Leptospira sp. B5-022]